MNNFLGYRCSLCQEEYGPDEVIYTCPDDGGNLDIIYDYARLQTQISAESLAANDDYSLWRYLPLLPVSDPLHWGTPLRSAGWTPIYSPPELRSQLGMQSFWVKDESRNPTASFKDRASAVVVARAKEIGAEVVVTASTGNAGAALAGMAAAVSQKAVIFAPRTAPPAKIAQLLIYNAEVLLVDGNYDQAFDLSVQAAEKFGWYCRNTGYNPFTLEGKKTAALEIWEQLISTKSLGQQLAVFVSVGDGNIISGLHKGFKDLSALGLLEQMPRIFGIQSEGSAAITNAFVTGVEEITPVTSTTLADSISVDFPRDGVRAVRAAKETGGVYLVVSDTEILQAVASLGRAGIFAEPAGGASFAGFLKALDQGYIGSGDPVLVLNTGSGLKDVGAAMQAVKSPPIIEPTLTAVENEMKNFDL
jgi:threonine synthase